MGETVIAAAKTPATNRENRASPKKTEVSQVTDSPAEQILFLQRTIGNKVVERLIESGALQAKLRIGAPGDVYEQEADRVAEQVMRMPEPEVTSELESSISAIRGGGQPLPVSLRAFYESRFGHDFSQVRGNMRRGRARDKG
jgi:hypothetical protein